MPKKSRLDDLLLSQGYVSDKNDAFIVVTEGRVFVNSQKAVSPAQMIGENDTVEVRRGREYVGRGAYKLEHAIVQFNIDARGKICADIGSATGGFVEVLLKHGAKKVYAIDTARGKLDLKLREDSRVIIMEETDVRDLDKLPEAVDLVTIDVSLISLRGILPAVRRIAPKAEVIALLKPQYETRDPEVLKHGVVRDEDARKKLFDDFTDWLAANGWHVAGSIESPIRGNEGNTEYLFYLRYCK
ncbi:MAG: TlyA family RNA methyltransferase [Candidatus Sungbacteria bacterium]|nr:TlyA family RNA methyltransferase [Candidatus Sungbacteria bacterium]